MLDKYDAQSTNLTQQKTNSESVQIKKFFFFYKTFTNPDIDCSESTKKTVQMYEIIYNFCTVLISQNSIKLEGNHREYIVR